MKDLLFYLFIAILLVVFILTVIFIYLTIQRIREKRHLQQIHHYIARHKGAFYLYFIEGVPLPPQAIPDTAIGIQASEAILSKYAQNICGEAMRVRLTHYAEARLHRYYKKQLQSRRRHARLNALNKIMDFRMKSLLEDVKEMINSRSLYTKEEYLLIYTILSMFKADSFFELLAHPKYEWGELDYKRILHGLDEEQFAVMIGRYHQWPPALQQSLVDIIGVKHLLHFVPFLEERLADDSSEIRIRSLKALSEIGFIRDLKWVVPFVYSIYWEERLMAAKLLAYLPSPASLKHLRELSQDSSWRVRSQAEESIQLQQRNDSEEQLFSFNGEALAEKNVQEALGEGR
ncbi:HEAT repeat domain-containing protein [Bacillus xiapuensis]|uniref:HEAT repeat domain-containing protein n=1 Tax=Bacillus xiapuensis TaxID=2014075 RepID=UPI000C24D159|nr:HEAT repeat domain-containing protein [Bacillus xiapuensis]